MFKTFILFLTMALWVIPAMPAQNETEAIRNLLEERDEEIKELLGPEGTDYTQEQRDKLKNIVNDIINYRAMAEFALGNTYHEISDEEREEFVSLFSTIIRDNSLNRLDIYRAEVTYNNIEVTNGEALVETTAQLDNVRTTVDYKLEIIDGEWMIVDMTIDDVSTAESYNRQYQNIIRRHGFDALLNSLRNRAARAST
jgi:phospholipid transport system substrate-binding protein